MSVNVSARQLERDDLVDDVRQALHESGLDPGALVLEITETTLMRDATATQRRLEALKGLGVRLAIDDFGTGYSSMAYLRRFPVDVIKIDRSFISGIADSGEAAVLLRTLVQMGQALGLETLAEGIEEDEHLAGLMKEHCESGQGFLFARPLAPEALEAFLQMPPATAVPSGRASLAPLLLSGG
jgi:EAL domain-containing protein (putative c-di-GMP-specific phosphodiesterase class I)